jgi:hypothetical protein
LKVLPFKEFRTTNFVHFSRLNPMREVHNPLHSSLKMASIQFLSTFFPNTGLFNKSMKHLKNSQQINYATGHDGSYANRERNSSSIFKESPRAELP